MARPMTMSMRPGMAATNIIQRQLFELFCRHLCEVVCDGTREGLKNFKAGLIQAG